MNHVLRAGAEGMLLFSPSSPLSLFLAVGWQETKSYQTSRRSRGRRGDARGKRVAGAPSLTPSLRVFTLDLSRGGALAGRNRAANSYAVTTAAGRSSCSDQGQEK